ncbi:hypothetical protein ACWV26_06495 [Rummeliibacillus sp. JY-2-4R]
MLENPLVIGQGYKETYATPVGRCIECNDLVFGGYEGVLFEDEIFCSTSCLADHLEKSDAVQSI